MPTPNHTLTKPNRDIKKTLSKITLLDRFTLAIAKGHFREALESYQFWRDNTVV